MAGRKLLVALLLPLIVIGGVLFVQGCGGGSQTDQEQAATEKEVTAGDESESAESMQEPAKAEKPEAEMALVGYTCSMHPEETSLEPGKCSQCGMELEEARVLYVCTMCPDEHSREPGKCSHCGMDLVLRPVPEEKEMGETH